MNKLALFIGIAIFAAPALAGPLMTAPPEVARPCLAAIQRFANALQNADEATLNQLLYTDGTTYQDTGKTQFIRLVMAHKRLTTAAIKRFGDAGKRFRPPFELAFATADRAALARAECYLSESGRVLVYIENQTTPVRLRNSEDRWQISLDLVVEPEGDDLSTNISEPTIRGMMAVADAIEKGTYATAALAEADLLSRIEALLPPKPRYPQKGPRR
jgi:hypothetical protein